MNTRVFDIEIFPNYLLASFYNPEIGAFDDFEYFGNSQKQDTKALRSYIKTCDILIGFNSLQYDNLVIKAFLNAGSIKAAKELSDKIIAEGKRKNERLAKNDVDVLGILDRKGGLKIFECRLGLPRVLESPIDFASEIAPEVAKAVKEYCHTDILATWALWSDKTTQGKYKVKSQASEVYGQALTSSSESEIASMVLQAEIKKILGMDAYAKMEKYKKPCLIFSGSEILNPAIVFENQALQKSLDEAKAFRFGQGYFKAAIELSGLTINIGQGGMHSVDKTAIITSLSDGQAIIDHDVSSYYPSIVLAEGIAPEGLETAFLAVYKGILESRLAAKKAGDKAKANCYKIILNSAYGKFGDKSSWLYNPKNMLRVTLNCQFRLLQLVEKIAQANIEILQINTDGVLCFCKSTQEQSQLKEIIATWQAMTGLDMEETRYSKLVMRDSNNYVAQYEKGSGCKEKGIFQSELNLFGGGSIPLVLARAARQFFFEGTEPEKTIADCENLLDFCLFAKRDKWVADSIAGLQPKVNRWVWGKDVSNVLKSATEKTTKTDDNNVVLANDLASIGREQLDIARYIQAAKDLIEATKTGKTPKAIEKERTKGTGPQNLSFFEDEQEPEQPEQTEKPIVYPPDSFQGNAVLQKLAERHPIAPTTGKECHVTAWQKKSRQAINTLSSIHKGNFAIRLDSLVVMDVDRIDDLTQEQQDKIKSLIPGTTVVYRRDVEQTKAIKAKGHFYFAAPDWLTSHVDFCKPGSISPTIEIRTGRELCTIPPSIHPDDKLPYTWHNVQPLLAGQLPELPKPLFDYLASIFPPKPEKTKTKQGSKLKAEHQKALDEIKGQISIWDVLDWYGIEHNGEKFRCVFHSEHHVKAGKVVFSKGDSTYSAQVYEDTKSFHCFGCKKDGDVVNLYGYLTGYGFSDALKELKKIAKDKAKQAKIIASIPTEMPKPQQPEMAASLADFKTACLTIKPKEIKIFSGGTGIGKTYMMLSCMTELAKLGEDVVFICTTVNEARRAVAKIKGMLQAQRLPESWLTLVTSKATAKQESDIAGDEDEETPISHKQTYSKILVTTGGYVGRKGQLACGYRRFHEMIENRIVFYDEVQELYQKMIVALPLLARYLLTGSTYERKTKCPKTGRQGNCSKCIMAALREDLSKRSNERNFYYKFAKAAENHHIVKPDLGVATWDSLIAGKEYQPVNGTLFYKPLFTKQVDTLQENSDSSFVGFLAHLLQYLDNPHVRNEWPIEKRTNAIVSPDTLAEVFTNKDTAQISIEDIRLPVLACGIPTICGLDTLAALQFFGSKVSIDTPKGNVEKEYIGAKAIVMISATVPQTLVRVFEKIAAKKGWYLQQAEITETPFKFDVTMLKASKALSVEKVAKIVAEMDKRTDAKGFIVASRKTEADNLVKELRDVIPEKITYFYGRDFEQELSTKASKNQQAQKYFVTYARSAISRGEDFEDVCFVVVDCQQFLPFAAIGEIHPLMDEAEKQAALSADIRQNLTQIVGRVLRSQLARIPGQTVNDVRKIVVLLHGLPVEVSDFLINPRLLHTTREYKESFIYPDDTGEKQVESIVDSMCRCLAGDAPKDYEKAATQEAIDKARAKGEESLSKEQRKRLPKEIREEIKSELDDKKKIERQALLSAKAKAMKEDGKTWREIARQLNLARIDKIFSDNIRKQLEL